MKAKTSMLVTVVVIAITLALLLWRSQNRFTFDGKAVDQHEAAIPGATILFHMGNKGVTRTSNTDGFFFYRGPDLGGTALGVTVEKSGYESLPEEAGKVGSSKLFDYSGAAGVVHRPDEQGPVVFHLLKPGPAKP